MKPLIHKVFQISNRTRTALAAGSAWLAAGIGSASRGPECKRLALEPLEPRLPLSATGLTDFVAEPTGALSGKIVYTSAGHGWQWSDNLGRWATDRGDYNEILDKINREGISSLTEQEKRILEQASENLRRGS